MSFKKIGACWKNKSGKGYSCKIEVALHENDRFMIFKNEKKTEDKHPDLIIGQFEEDKDGKQS